MGNEVLHLAPVKRGRGRPPGPKAATQTAAPAKPVAEAPSKPAVALVMDAQAALGQGNRVAAAVGMILGGFVPLASYTLVHCEVAQRPELWVLVGGGLVYSALTVYQWAHQAFQYRAKAVGFVILLEGAMTLSRVRWLGISGLAILMALNGVSAAVSLQGRQKERPNVD